MLFNFVRKNIVIQQCYLGVDAALGSAGPETNERQFWKSDVLFPGRMPSLCYIPSIFFFF